MMKNIFSYPPRDLTLLTWHGMDNFLLLRNVAIPHQVNRTLKLTIRFMS